MSLFQFEKKTKENAVQCTCNGTGDSQEVTEIENNCCSKVLEEICTIKVLGSGCKSCHDLFEHVQKVVQSMEILVRVEYVTDMQKIMEYGVMSMPALVVNEKVVSAGKVLKPADVEKLFQELGY